MINVRVFVVIKICMMIKYVMLVGMIQMNKERIDYLINKAKELSEESKRIKIELELIWNLK